MSSKRHKHFAARTSKKHNRKKPWRKLKNHLRPRVYKQPQVIME